MASGRERPCVAINPDGSVAMHFSTIKDAAWGLSVPLGSMHRIMARGKKIGDYKVMFEDVYDKMRDGGFLNKYTWFERGGGKRGRQIPTDATFGIAEDIVSSTFREYASFHIQWLHELMNKWLESPVKEVYPWSIADYYEDERDKEVAVFASMTISIGKDCHDKIWSLMRKMGGSPWKWFCTRSFVCAIGKGKDDRLQNLMDFLWDDGFADGSLKSIRERIEMLPYFQNNNYGAALELMLDRGGLWEFCDKASLAVLVLGNAGRVGKHIWDTNDTPIPKIRLVRKFLEKWFPDWEKCGSMENAVAQFGVTSPDFLCMALAYGEARNANRSKYIKYEMKYKRGYLNKNFKKRTIWEALFPQISFD